MQKLIQNIFKLVESKEFKVILAIVTLLSVLYRVYATRKEDKYYSMSISSQQKDSSIDSRDMQIIQERMYEYIASQNTDINEETINEIVNEITDISITNL
jgi:hypothetical protein